MSENSKNRKILSLELWVDVQRCTDLLEMCKDPDEIQFYRRAYIRAAFAYIEGTIFDYRLAVLNAHKRGDMPPFSAPDLALLEDKELYLGDQGEFVTRRAKASLAPLIRFSFRAIITAKKLGYEPKYGDKGWNCLQSAIKYRDQLMHPKSVDGIQTTDEEWQEISSGIMWFHREVASIMNHLLARGAVGDDEYNKMIEERQAMTTS